MDLWVAYLLVFCLVFPFSIHKPSPVLSGRVEGLCKPWFIQNGVESRAIDHQTLAICRANWNGNLSGETFIFFLSSQFQKLVPWTPGSRKIIAWKSSDIPPKLQVKQLKLKVFDSLFSTFSTISCTIVLRQKKQSFPFNHLNDWLKVSEVLHFQDHQGLKLTLTICGTWT